MRPIDYKKYFECSVKDQIEYLKTMNIQNAELVHDPSIEHIERIEIAPSAEQIQHDKRFKPIVSPVTLRRMKNKENQK